MLKSGMQVEIDLAGHPVLRIGNLTAPWGVSPIPGRRGQGSRQLDAQRALAFGRPELLENVLPEHLLGDAHTDLGDRRRFLAFFGVEAEVIAQVDQPLPMADADGLEIRMAVGELRAVGVEQTKLGGVIRCVGGDDEVEMGRHGDWASL